MLAVLNAGNTNITVGVYKENTLVGTFSLKHDDFTKNNYIENIQAILKNKTITKCIIGSVCDEITPKIVNVAETIHNIKPMIAVYNMNLGIGIKAEHPEKFGIDRIANACAASKLYKKSTIVIDAGTATTFDIIDENNNFIGGVIFSGVNTQLKSLAKDTSKLPFVNADDITSLTSTINTDTKSAILAGVIKGHAYAIDGLIEDCINEMNCKPYIVATGGLAGIISKYTKKYKFDEVNPFLTIEGLKIMYDLNSRF